MYKYRKYFPEELLQNIEANFSELLDYIIYYDSVNEDLRAWKIIYAIEQISDTLEIHLLIQDLHNRHFSNGPTLLYNALWYGVINDRMATQILIHYLKKEKDALLIAHLLTLKPKNTKQWNKIIPLLYAT